MKLKVEVFEESILVSVTQDANQRNIAVLSAGLKKYISSSALWIYVDFLQCTISEDAKSAILALKQLKLNQENTPSTAAPEATSTPPPPAAAPEATPTQKPPASAPQVITDQELMKKVILIGQDLDIFEFKSIDEAVVAKRAKEGLLLLEKIALQKELDTLTQKKTILSDSLAKSADKSQGKMTLFKLNRALKGLHRVLTLESKRTNLKLNRIKRRISAEPEQIASMKERKKAIITKLMDIKLLNKQ